MSLSKFNTLIECPSSVIKHLLVFKFQILIVLSQDQLTNLFRFINFVLYLYALLKFFCTLLYSVLWLNYQLFRLLFHSTCQLLISQFNFRKHLPVLQFHILIVLSNEQLANFPFDKSFKPVTKSTWPWRVFTHSFLSKLQTK